ncbi:hypothetical protein RDABS01_011280 [Bienertia sinuspersici]
MQCFKIPNGILDEIEKMCRGFFWGQKQEERKQAWVAWEKLYQPKKEGGLGVRDMKAFNKALLAKQAWRILTNESSLMARVLKGKYFHTSNFMEAKVSQNASYTWRSILFSRNLLSRGLRKIVGMGSTIKIWEDPYETSEDWVWQYSKNGGFTVRSAYFLELERKKEAGTSSTSTSNKGASKTLWKALVPPKVKMFGWRVLHGGVQVRKKLKLRGMELDERCPMCGDSEESILHMLFRCNEAEVRRRYLPLRLEFHPDKFSCIKGWLEFLACTYKDVLWISGEQVVHKAISLVGEVEEANRKDLRSRNSEIGGSIWQPPHQLWYKLNSDAAIFEGGSKEVEVAEALAARHGLSIAIEVGLTSIILETDCIKLYQHLKKGKREASYFGKIVQDIIHLAKRCNCISYAHIKRSGNRVAHELAKISKDYSEMMVLIEEVPPSMHNYVMVDVLSLNS